MQAEEVANTLTVLTGNRVGVCELLFGLGLHLHDLTLARARRRRKMLFDALVTKPDDHSAYLSHTQAVALVDALATNYDKTLLGVHKQAAHLWHAGAPEEEEPATGDEELLNFLLNKWFSRNDDDDDVQVVERSIDIVLLDDSDDDDDEMQEVAADGEKMADGEQEVEPQKHCEVCTFLNRVDAAKCQMCGSTVFGMGEQQRKVLLDGLFDESSDMEPGSADVSKAQLKKREEVIAELSDRDIAKEPEMNNIELVKEVEVKEVEVKEVEVKEVKVKEVEVKEVEAKEVEAKEVEMKEVEVKEVEGDAQFREWQQHKAAFLHFWKLPIDSYYEQARTSLTACWMKACTVDGEEMESTVDTKQIRKVSAAALWIISMLQLCLEASAAASGAAITE